MSYEYQVVHADISQLVSLPFIQEEHLKTGTFDVVVEGKVVGEVDICHQFGTSYVSVKLVDTFLTIEQMMKFLSDLKQDFCLPDNQKISIEHV